MNKFYTWFANNRRIIGLVVAILSILAGLLNAAMGFTITGLMQLVAGLFISYDVWTLE